MTCGDYYQGRRIVAISTRRGLVWLAGVRGAIRMRAKS